MRQQALTQVNRWYMAKLARSFGFFSVEPFEGRYKVTFRANPEREKEIKCWFREHGHQAREWHGISPGWYLKCSKDIAMLAKLTFGGQ